MHRRLFLQSATAAALAPLPGAAAEPVYLSDMSRCLPQSALTRKPRHKRWRLLDYETESFKGTMLVAGQNTAAPEVRCPLRTRGWHSVWLGIRSYGGGEAPTQFQVKLSSDRSFTFIVHRSDNRNRLDEYFWKAADLTDQDILFRQHTVQIVPNDPDSVANRRGAAWIGYIKLVPLSATEVREIQEERRSGRHRRLFAHHDAWSYTYEYHPTTVEEIWRELEPFRDTDFSRVYWEGGMGDRMYYPSKLGLTAADDWIEDPFRDGDRLAQESFQTFRKKGIDPFKVALEYVHSMGLELHATYRPAGFHFPVPEDEWNTGGIYDKHPEWRGRDKQGRPTPRLSYAFPEVRKVALDFVKEMASYPVDGVCIAYNRRPPLVEYETPVVESFRAKFGKDPRQLPDYDPQWLKHRATILTAFMRELRAALKEVAARQKRGRPLEITAITMGDERENLYFAMDLEAWIREGLVDTIAPYSTHPRLLSSADSFTNPKDAEFFYRITRGTACKLALNLMPRVQPPDEFRKRAHALYRAGSEYFFLWDTNARYDYSPSWSALRRLGHKEELEALARAGSPPFPKPGKELRKLGDWDLTYVTPG